MRRTDACRGGIGLLALAVVCAIALAACAGTGSLPGVETLGNIKILGLKPFVLTCAVEVGDWIKVEGQSFGTRGDWDSGSNTVTFPPDPPGVEATGVQLADLEGVDSLQYLYVQVPFGAESGTMVIDVGENGLAYVPVQIVDASSLQVQPAMAAVTMCQQIEPPPPQ